ncbi:hypothetical protein AURDEDRAFT_119307 [Auricularia subglabra TFB-10046 SS5]|nr:hypothetical protein AURDEDRAFT_119307 [Auricularia subglabra TFB-10046 SS5]
MPFPLELFPVPAYDVHTHEPYEESFAHDIALMKNALLRAANAIHARAPAVKKDEVADFVAYVQIFITVLRLSQAAEQQHIWPRLSPYIPIQPSEEERSELEDRADGFDNPLADAREDTALYDGAAICAVLESMGDELRAQMLQWIESVSPEQLEKCKLKSGELKELVIQDVVFIAQTMGNYFPLYLPWLTAHADKRVNAYWPPIPDHDKEILEEFVNERKGVWKFAPFHPVTGEPQN